LSPLKGIDLTPPNKPYPSGLSGTQPPNSLAHSCAHVFVKTKGLATVNRDHVSPGAKIHLRHLYAVAHLKVN
ncbi:MAG: hypothetical protein ACXW39_05700, partial [Nitrospira sp.]